MLTGPYRNCYSRVYVFSPSCAPGVDPSWDAWRKHVRDFMGIKDEEQTMWSTWEPEILTKLIDRHQKVNAHLKAKRHKRGYTLLVLVDDVADQCEQVTHNSTNIFNKPIRSRPSPWLRVLASHAEAAGGLAHMPH